MSFENEYGELPGDLCCLRSAGGICFDHAKMYGDAGLVQLAESRIRTPQDGVQVSGPAPEFEQVSRCCK